MFTLFYRLLMPLLSVLYLPFILLKKPEERARWRQQAERFGLELGLRSRSHPTSTSLWVHAASVGEVIAVTPLLRQLAAQYGDQLLVTTFTAAGQDQLARSFGDTIRCQFLPLDIPCCIARFLRQQKPVQLVLVERELWPELLSACQQQGVKTTLINARLSPRSAARYRKRRHTRDSLFAKLDQVLVQTPADATLYAELGVPESRIQLSGNLKYDITPSDEAMALGQTLRAQLHARPVWAVASTHNGEEAQILDCFTQLKADFPALLLLLIPRHPYRFDEVVALCQQTHWHCERRTTDTAPSAQCDIFVGDTIGEMMGYLASADLVFMGGSLVEIGGHNLMEPASLGKPCLIGPHDFNFTDITAQLREAGGVYCVADSQTLTQQVRQLLQDSEAAHQCGQAALQVVQANQGALAKTLTAIIE